VKRALAYLAILLVIAGCSMGEALQDPGDPVDMTLLTLAGTWHGGTQRFISFNGNGTFSATNLPSPPFQDLLGSIGFDPARHQLDGSGTWSLTAAPDQPAYPHATVHLSFDRLAGRAEAFDGPDLSALRPGDGQVYLVMFYVGDQGNSSTGYLKCASVCHPTN
jgi:hypothetical protein